MARVRFDTAQFEKGHAGLLQDIDDLVVKADAFNGAAAIDEEDLFAKRGCFFAEVGQLIFAKINFRSILKYEIVHYKSPFLKNDSIMYVFRRLQQNPFFEILIHPFPLLQVTWDRKKARLSAKQPCFDIRLYRKNISVSLSNTANHRTSTKPSYRRR